MPLALRRYFGFGHAPAGEEKEWMTRLAATLVCGTAIAAGGYFALLYWLAGR